MPCHASFPEDLSAVYHMYFLTLPCFGSLSRLGHCESMRPDLEQSQAAQANLRGPGEAGKATSIPVAFALGSTTLTTR